MQREIYAQKIFDVPDSTVIFCKLQQAWNEHARLQNVTL